ncbi:uroporphyrinogen-III synthase [Rhodoferax lacus]|uniref:Uroporphyrinogen-III synthase n=1 Tax=Rhodoferax lacus TaxID=2184758 RepID=A0A3E1R862_9BURK|nr:uroporphyrinogen-III synthase [Rhodoferax lacus]RFO95507.1 uroporphyrinogen-III synthase [Rhodoferax lacus]
MRVIVTRPAPQAGKWVNALRAAGLDAVSLPLIEITGPPEPQAVLAVWQRVQAFDALMFVSANAVEQFFALQPAGLDLLQAPTLTSPRCFATGPGTVAALLQAGVPGSRIDAPDHTAHQFDSEALWAVVHAQVQPGWRVLIVRGNSDAENGDEAEPAQGLGRDWLAARLAEKGAVVEFLVAYARRAPLVQASARALLQVASSDGSLWLFSSSEAVNNLRSMAPGLCWHQARAVATHPRIAEAARAAGFAVVCESRPAMADLIASIESLA